MSDTQKIPLSELIAELRSELVEAQKEGTGKKLRFKIEEIEIELKVGITKEVEAGGKVKFWVYEAGIKGDVKEQDLQRICLKIKPSGSKGVDGESDESFEVSGRGAKRRSKE